MPSDANAWLGGNAYSDEGSTSFDLENEVSKIITAEEASNKTKKAIIQIRYDKRPARLLTNRRASDGFGWIKYDDNGSEDEVDLKDASVVAIVED